MSTIYNAMTVDVEDYFMVSTFADVIKFKDWHMYESRVEVNTRKILELLSESNVKATFFALGWLAEKSPQLIRDIHSAGHEVACHSYNHRLVYDLSPEEFRQDARKSKSILENITGVPVVGYRAPSYSIVKKNLWALDIISEEGFKYDSSIFPIHHDLYGFPEAERFPHIVSNRSGTLWEFPLSTVRFFSQNIPIAGGGYLRFFPLNFTKAAVKKINEKENKSVIFYVHPWEIDVNQPVLNGKWLSRKRHYFNLKSTMPKLRALLKEFKFKPLCEFVS